MLVILMNIKMFPKMFYYYILMLLTILLVPLNLYHFYFTLNINYIMIAIVKLFIINELLRIYKNTALSDKQL